MADKIRTRAEIPEEYKWKITDIYADDTLWEKDYELVKSRLAEFEKFHGNAGKSAENLLALFRLNDEISLIADKLYVYAVMRFHEDSGNTVYQALSDKAEMLIIEYSQAVSFITPEITELDDKTVESYIESCGGLKIYRHYLENIMRCKSHILSKDIEKLLSKTGEIASAPQSIFTMINDADMVFSDITNEKGEKVPLTKGNYVSYLESSNRSVRKEAFETLYDAYLKQENTLAATYAASVKKDVFYSQVRKFPSSLEQALDDDNIPVSVYDNLISAVNKNLHLMHRYVKLRKKMLGVDELHMYDLYAPLVADSDKKINFEDAKATVLKALEPMGEDYTENLKKGFNGGWIDVYENKGKRSGAYSWGTYSVHPYVLLNHNDNVNSMFTIAHEMGHALHSLYTWNTQPYIYSGHKIFVAEVASTVNEALLMEYLLKTNDDKKFTAYLINYFMEQFKGTFFRQAMFAEFEAKAHELAEKGTPLTCGLLKDIYHKLNEKYFGDGIVIDDRIDIEWARIPHFYNAFYVYQYSTGYSAAISLSRKILNEGKSAADRYKSFLTKGDSEYSIDLLKGAGVDMTTEKPFEDAMKVFEGLLDRMENLVL